MLDCLPNATQAMSAVANNGKDGQTLSSKVKVVDPNISRRQSFAITNCDRKTDQTQLLKRSP